ncbi:MAG: phage tail tape measure protein [Verrucomicrobiales bacterium]|nr:phage tail tape measure protein [Verrucomicrobiales bacterium]|tara:strand:- start:323 stop:8452 length:8130 start_codon:yes stop_codon:yes gene_type:complete
MSINVNVHANTDPLVRDVHAAVDRINRSGRLKIRIDDKGVTQPLGNMKRGADEFTKSLEASNARVLAFGASVGVINAVAGAFKGLVQATMEVEKNLTDINVVMGLTTGQLDKFGGGLMKVAAETGAGFRAASEAATEFARQGLSVNETLKRTKDALILTRLTGMKAADSVKSLTAAMNTFKGEIADSTALVSKFAAVDVKFAVSAEDFAQAIARAGQSARSAGVDINQLIGLVTAAQERTARGGAVIGNAFKTIFTRVRRSSTLAELENLGIAVRDLQGKTLPAMKIMQSLANTYDTLTDAQRAYISQNVAGVFQINILKAALADLGKTNSVTAQATAIAASATDESNRKNEQLRQTMSALATETGVAVQELAKKIGDIALAPGINKVLDGIKGMAEGLGGILGDGEQEGNKFAQGLLRGVGNILTGPGLVMFAAVAGKLFVNAVKYAQQSLGSLLNINKTANARRNIEQSLMQVLTQNAGLQKEMLRTDISREQKERTILQLIQQQTQEASRLAALTKSMAPVMMRQGIGPGLSMRSGGRGALGFIPNYAAADDEKAEARKGGYAPGAVRTMRMPGVGSVVYNTAERVKKFPGLTQPAIMPPGGKAKDNYAKEFYGAHGFDPYMAGGYVPNFAIKILTGRYPNRTERTFKTPEDAIAAGISPKHSALAQYNLKSSAVTTPATAYNATALASMLIPEMKSGVLPPITRTPTPADRAVIAGKFLGDKSLSEDPRIKRPYIFRGFGIQESAMDKFSESKYGGIDGLLKKQIIGAVTNYANRIKIKGVEPLGKSHEGAIEAKIFATKDDRSGMSGALGALYGAIFETALETRLKTEASDPETPGGDFDVKRVGPNIRALFGKDVAKMADYKAQDTSENRESMAAKIAKEVLWKSGVKATPKPKSKKASMGFVPNFADPLSDAIGREMSAGVPVSKIRIGSHKRLVGRSNPAGLGVTNTDDEPNGLRDVLGATGIVPNYFLGAMNSWVGKSRMGKFFGSQTGIQEANDAAAKTAAEYDKTSKKLDKGRDLQDKLQGREKRLQEQKEKLEKEGRQSRLKSRRERRRIAQEFYQNEKKLSATTRALAKVRTLNKQAGSANAAAEKRNAEAAKKAGKRERAANRAGMAGMAAMMGANMIAGQIQGSEGFETSGLAQASAGALNYGAMGASMGMMIGPWGAAAGALIGAGWGVYDGIKKAEEASRKIADEIKKAGEAAEKASDAQEISAATALLSRTDFMEVLEQGKFGSGNLNQPWNSEISRTGNISAKQFVKEYFAAAMGAKVGVGNTLAKAGMSQRNAKNTTTLSGARVFFRGDEEADGNEVLAKYSGYDSKRNFTSSGVFKLANMTPEQFRNLQLAEEKRGDPDTVSHLKRMEMRANRGKGGFRKKNDLLDMAEVVGPNAEEASMLSVIASLGGMRTYSRPNLREYMITGAEKDGKSAGLMFDAMHGKDRTGELTERYRGLLKSWIQENVDDSVAPQTYMVKRYTGQEVSIPGDENRQVIGDDGNTATIPAKRPATIDATAVGQTISAVEYAKLAEKDKAKWKEVKVEQQLGKPELLAAMDEWDADTLVDAATAWEAAAIKGTTSLLAVDKANSMILQTMELHLHEDLKLIDLKRDQSKGMLDFTHSINKTQNTWEGLTSETSKVWSDYNIGMRKASDKHAQSLLAADVAARKALEKMIMDERGEGTQGLKVRLGLRPEAGDNELRDAILALDTETMIREAGQTVGMDKKKQGDLRVIQGNRMKAVTSANVELWNSEGKLKANREENLIIKERVVLKARMARFDKNTQLKERLNLLQQELQLTRSIGAESISLAEMQGGTARQRFSSSQRQRKLKYEAGVESTRTSQGQELLQMIKRDPALKAIVDKEGGFDIKTYQGLDSSQAKADYLMGLTGKLKARRNAAEKKTTDKLDSLARHRALYNQTQVAISQGDLSHSSPHMIKKAEMYDAMVLSPEQARTRLMQALKTGSLDPISVEGGEMRDSSLPAITGDDYRALKAMGNKRSAHFKAAFDARNAGSTKLNFKDGRFTLGEEKGAWEGGVNKRGGASGDPRDWQKSYTKAEREALKKMGFDSLKLSRSPGALTELAGKYKERAPAIDKEASQASLDIAVRKNLEAEKLTRQKSKEIGLESHSAEALSQSLEAIRGKSDEHAKVLAKMEAEYEIAKKLAEIEHGEKRGEGAFGRGMNRAMNQIQDRVETFNHSLGEAIPEAFSNGMSNAMMNAIRNGGKLKDVLRDAALSFLDTFNQKMMGHFADQATMALFGSGERRTRKGYAKGGLVGFNDGGLAMVSNQEYRMRPEAVKKYGVGMMDAVNSGHFQRKGGGGPSWAMGLGGIAGSFLASKLFGKKEEDNWEVRKKDRFETDGQWKRQNMSAHYMQNNARVQEYVGELKAQDQANTQKFIEKAEKRAQMGRQIFTAVASIGAQKLGAHLEKSGAFGKADMAMGLGKNIEMSDGTLAKMSPDGQVFKVSSDAGYGMKAAAEMSGTGHSFDFKQSSGMFGGKKDYGYLDRGAIESYAESQGGGSSWFHDDGSFKFSSREKPGRLSTWANSPWKKGSVGEKATEATKKLKEFIKDTGRKIIPLRKATGGKIVGQSGIDQIPTMLSEGEYVIRADAVRKMGVPTLDKINAGRFNKGGIVTNASSDPGGSLGGASTNNVSITVNVDKSGGESSGGDDERSGDGGEDKMDKFSSRIKDQVITVIKEESRPGGLLDDGA